MDLLGPDIYEMFLRLTMAMLFGFVLGAERVFARQTAGMRTYALVSLGAALFITISLMVSEAYVDATSFDPLRVASQIVVGIGFLGAGVIVFREERLRGLTTAAGLWVSAGIGTACGYGLYPVAAFATLLTLFIFSGMWFIEKKLKDTLDSGDVRIEANPEESSHS